MRWVWAVGPLAGICMTTACSVPSVATPAASTPATSPARSGSVTATAPARTAAATASAAPAPAPAPQVTIARVRTADGSIVTVATFRGPVRYVLHNGSQDPGPAAAGLVRAGPAVTGAERRRLLAAFNGGFKLAAGAGGYEQEGHVISPLRSGFASLVIDRSGQARIAMELDINPYTVQLDTARRPGGPLTAAVPGQNRPADQYLAGWTRDFITVLAPPAGPQPTASPINSWLRP